jgi:hypothetical protein
MERAFVIAKQEDPTEWCHNLVLVKKNVKLRICLDPVPMNRFIQREEFQKVVSGSWSWTMTVHF